MIGLDELGSKGWLGNQMFQYASLRGIASNKKYEFCVPPKDSSRIHNYLIHDAFELNNCDNIRYINYPTYYSDHTDFPNSCAFGFNENIFNNCPDNVNINGFFQSEKYFKHIEKEIREDFTFKNHYLLYCKDIISKFNEDLIFLHVRRGDYVGSPHFNNLSEDYYREALSHFDENQKVLVFSDDIEWCKNWDFLKSNRFIFLENAGHNLIIDLCLMTLCSGAIIANSTFAWWGAWLQENNKKTVAPKNWFGPALSHLDSSDIIPERWILI
jgi:hypothetical protein